MRLYLSSFRLGNRPEELSKLCRDAKRAIVIANACDLMSESERVERVELERRLLDECGFSTSEIDLRQYFPGARPRAALRMAIDSVDLVWVRGGNPFVLRRAFRLSGFDDLVLQAIRGDTLVYAGYSAGAAMMTPSLACIDKVDDPHEVPPGYDTGIIWECMGLVPFSIAPHYRSDHPESRAIDDVVNDMIVRKVPFIALKDGEVLVIDGNEQRVIL